MCWEVWIIVSIDYGFNRVASKKFITGDIVNAIQRIFVTRVAEWF